MCAPLFFILCITGCDSSKVSLPKSSFIGAAAIGDLISIDIEGDKFRFKGLVGKLDNINIEGKLRKAEGFERHVYESPDMPGFTLVYTPDSVTYHENGNEFGKYGVTVPKISTNYSATSIAGNYNYVSQYAGNMLEHGTFTINPNNTWSLWIGVNGSNVDNSNAQGTWEDKGLGYLLIKGTAKDDIDDNVAFNAHAMLNQNGVLVIDLVTNHGIAIGMKQQEIQPISAKYDVISSGSSELELVTVNQKKAIIGEHTIPLDYNNPWTGFVSHDTNFMGVLSPSANTFFGFDKQGLFVAVKQ